MNYEHIFAIYIYIYLFIYLYICCFLTNIIPTFAGPHGLGFLVHWPVSVDFLSCHCGDISSTKEHVPVQRDADLANEKWI